MAVSATAAGVSETVAAWLGLPKGHLIGGAWTPGSGETAPVVNPADGSAICEVAMGGAAEVDAACRAAQGAFDGWRETPALERARLLHRLADRLESRASELAEIESLDVGKAITAAEGFDVPFGVEGLRYFADLVTQASLDSPLALKGIEARVHREPYGVCGFVFPWNFPFDLFVWGVGPALAAGNTVVVKPSEVTPLSTLFVAEQAAEVGFPAGVINVVVGDGPSVGSPLVEHPAVRRVSFTGSPEVGRVIGEACGRRLIPCKLELGGKGAAVVLDDADVGAAAEGLAGAITLNTGQVCCTATRWVVHESIADEFESAVVEKLRGVQIGPGLDRRTQMGPVVNAAQRDRVLSYVERGVREGASAALRMEAGKNGGGFFVGPAVLRGGEGNVCFRDEIFGPVGYITTFREEAEAIEQVNRIDYGLANSVWTRDLGRADRVATRLVAGNNWINAHNVFAYGLPYGGVNRSGFGGGVNSPATLFDYLRPMTIARPL